MRVRDAERFIVYFRLAMKAVVYENKNVRDAAFADLRKQLDKVRGFTDFAADGHLAPPTGYWLASVGLVRVWLDATTDEEREALTTSVSVVIDTLAKYFDGTLIPPRTKADVARAIGGG